MNSPAAQTMRAEIPRPACVVQRLSRGPEYRPALKRSRDSVDFCPSLAVDRNSPSSRSPGEPRRLSDPLGGAEHRRVVGGSRLALSEPKASLASRPTTRVAQGTRRSRAPTQGWPSFLATFSWPNKKKYARRQGGTQRTRKHARASGAEHHPTSSSPIEPTPPWTPDS